MSAREQQRNLFTGRWRNVVGRSPKEHELQIQLVSLLKWCKREDVLMFHVPNGELRDKVAAAKLRAMGVLPGVSDLVFLWKRYWEDSEGSHTAPAGLFLELKRGGGIRQLTTEQAAFGVAVCAMGYDFEVAGSIEQAIDAVGRRGLIKPNVEVCGRRWP